MLTRVQVRLIQKNHSKPGVSYTNDDKIILALCADWLAFDDKQAEAQAAASQDPPDEIEETDTTGESTENETLDDDLEQLES